MCQWSRRSACGATLLRLNVESEKATACKTGQESPGTFSDLDSNGWQFQGPVSFDTVTFLNGWWPRDHHSNRFSCASYVLPEGLVEPVWPRSPYHIPPVRDPFEPGKTPPKSACRKLGNFNRA